MFKEIAESEEVRQDPAECETVFNSLETGDTVLLTAWGGGDEYIKAEFTVTNVQRDTSSSDDYISGNVESESATLRLPWYPAEKNVGIPRPYSEGPIRFEFRETTYDVSSLEKQ